ncbi:MAG: tetratricopeptide repeat protein [Magnetococcales bacterium]|nr:tetratricopeptide repeat protein [Magnetococcales bacterium]NGZ04872.1 tetratricopeptide repeat protein [Magnetococcales bacterium]
MSASVQMPIPPQLHAEIVAAYRSGDLIQALERIERWLLIVPEAWDARLQAGVWSLSLGQAGRAEAHFRLAAAHPDESGQAQAWQGLGKALHDQGRLDAAEAVFRQARAVDPVPALADYHIGLCRLLRGDFQNGWPGYEQRLHVPAFRHRTLDRPRWQGEELSGGRLLILAEQGFGDVIQMVRFVPELVSRFSATQIVLETPQELWSLFQCLTPGVSLFPLGVKLEPGPKDRFVAVASLAGILKIDQERLPGRMPYLAASRKRVDDWNRFFGTHRPAVGVCWAGRASHPQDGSRSCFPEYFSALARIPGVHLFRMQKEMDRRWQPLPGTENLFVADLAPQMSDFAETAAMVAALDLVITVDTSLAHLAGALQRPVWLLLPHVPDWRWLLDGEHSPWYPSMRLFRQTRTGGWPELFERVAGAWQQAQSH